MKDVSVHINIYPFLPTPTLTSPLAHVEGEFNVD